MEKELAEMVLLLALQQQIEQSYSYASGRAWVSISNEWNVEIESIVNWLKTLTSWKPIEQIEPHGADVKILTHRQRNLAMYKHCEAKTEQTEGIRTQM